MNTWVNVAHGTLEQLPYALGHSLWQGLLVAILVYGLLRTLPAGRASTRYGVAVCGLAAIVVVFLATWAFLGDPNGVAPGGEAAEFQATNVESTSAERPGLVASGHGADTEPSQAATANGDGFVRTRGIESYTPVVLMCWSVGVVAMLGRLVWLMVGVGWLRRASRAVDHATVMALFEEMKALVGVSRRIALRVADDLVVPVAMGFVWPVVVLPASFVSRVAPDQLRAVLAHELAHVRRYDYLVNFVQLVVEAVLYFNPAVWWVSRQIRVEREACCDAVAARAMGDALDYADALACVARYVRDGYAPAMAQGFGAPVRRDTMLDRVRRVLVPGHRPRLRLRWYSVVVGTAVSVGAFAVLYQSAAMAKWMLTDQERIAALEELAEVYQPPLWDDNETPDIPIRVTIRTSDGSEPPWDDGRVKAIVERGNSIGHIGLGRNDGDVYSCKVLPGMLYVSAIFPGYAPYVLGPLTIGNDVPSIEVDAVLEPSVPATIRFVTPEGFPIKGVHATGGYQFLPSSWSNSLRLTSDSAGKIAIDQAEEPVPIVLKVRAEGFQESERRGLVLNPGEVSDWVLRPDAPVSGTVVDRDTGAPVAGVGLVQVYRSDGWMGDCDDEPRARSDSSGLFALRGLNPTQRYWFVTKVDGYGSELIEVEAGRSRDIRLTLGPRYVRGTIRGDLSLLKRRPDGVPIIAYGMPLHIPGSGTTIDDSSNGAVVDVVGVEGRFVIDGIRAGELYIAAGPERVRVPVLDSVENLMIELWPKELQERPVLVRFPVPEGAPAADGMLRVEVHGEQSYRQEHVPIIAGRAEFPVVAPSRCVLRVERSNGYIPAPRREGGYAGHEVPIGDGQYEIEIPLQRAGAINGQVFRADGAPAAGARIYVHDDSADNGAWPLDYPAAADNSVTCDEHGRFAVLPVPLEETFEVRASIDFAKAATQAKASATQPAAYVELRLPEGVDVPISIVDPTGAPMPDVAIEVDYPGGGHTGLRADLDGVFVLRGADPNAEYFVEAQPARDFQFTRIRVPFDRREVVLRLEKGLQARGVVVWEATGEPVPNAVVRARMAYDPEAQAYRQYEVQTTTDSSGAFAFTNLCEGRFEARAGAFQSDYDMEPVEFVAGQDEAVVVRLTGESDSWGERHF